MMNTTDVLWHWLQEKFMEADNLIKDGHIAEAVRMLEYIVTHAPDFGRAYNHLGWIYETKYQDFAQAADYYELALEKEPSYLPTYSNYAVLLSTTRRFDRLKAVLEQGLAQEGINTARMYNEYGLMQELQHDYQAAIQSYEASIKDDLDIESMQRSLQAIERCEEKMKFSGGFHASDR
ncbi:MAG: tetratricopeptide repeat protein [Bernardetiaceae bacterium]|nr:tetratricopeptide repeat protein [Bernardetiaceae bacterium]